MLLFERAKSINVRQIANNSLEVSARLKDRFHEIETTVVLDIDSRVIREASAEMITVPFDLCREVTAKMHELAGLKVKRGIRKWVQEIVGGPRGCAHLNDLVLDSVKAVIQVADFCLLPDDMPFDEKLQKIQATNMGICHTYSNLNRHPKYVGNRDI